MTARQTIGLRRLGFAAAAVLAMGAMPVAAQSPAGIPGVVAPGVAPELVQEGFVFTEGPVGTADGGLYFSDVRVSKTEYLDPSGTISVARENTNGGNGLALTKTGELVFAEGAGKRVTRREKDGSITVLTEGIPGTPLLAPNDLILDAKGGVYFSDPGPGPFPPPDSGRPTRTYYLPAGAKMPVVIDTQNPIPNGLTLTNDEKILIVDDTSSANVIAFDVQPDGTGANRRTYATLQGIPAGKISGADGIAIDSAGRIYVATAVGVQVFDAKGQYLGTIAVPRQPANLAFSGPDKQTLYITAREGLYRIKMLAKGPARLGK